VICGADQRLAARGEGLGFAQNAQEVAAGQGSTVAFGPAAGQELGEQGGIRGHVLQADRDVLGAVEVTADAYVLDLRDLADVLDVVRGLGQRGLGGHGTTGTEDRGPFGRNNCEDGGA
jgi:hypothetical protein